jgi:hypothetical protein
MTEFVTTPDINEAWDRIAHTSDGQTIYRHLMRLVMAPSPDDSALPRHEGARTLARNLMDLMAKGIVDSDRYCVAFLTRSRDPEPDTKHRGPARRVTLTDAERVGHTELDKSLARFEPPGSGNGDAGAA